MGSAHFTDITVHVDGVERSARVDNRVTLLALLREHDGFQCGYCTPGQICSAVGMLDEVKAGPSHVTDDIEQSAELTDDETSERMSGNLCRCVAYPNIVAAIHEAAR